MTVIRNWLIIRADGAMRLRTRRPSADSLGLDEVAVPIVVHMPDGWGLTTDDQIDIHMPDPPAVKPADEPIIIGENNEERT